MSRGRRDAFLGKRLPALMTRPLVAVPEGRGAPASRESDLCQLVSVAWRLFAADVARSGEDFGIGARADRDRGHRAGGLGKVELPPGDVGVETGHLMRRESVGHRLQGQVLGGQTDTVLRQRDIVLLVAGYGNSQQ